MSLRTALLLSLAAACAILVLLRAFGSDNLPCDMVRMPLPPPGEENVSSAEDIYANIITAKVTYPNSRCYRGVHKPSGFLSSVFPKEMPYNTCVYTPRHCQ